MVAFLEANVLNVSKPSTWLPSSPDLSLYFLTLYIKHDMSVINVLAPDFYNMDRVLMCVTFCGLAIQPGVCWK